MLCLETTDEDVVRRFHEIVQCGNLYQPPRRAGKPLHHKRLWRWRCTRLRDVKMIQGMFAPWLGVRRTKQMAQKIEAAENARQRAVT